MRMVSYTVSMRLEVRIYNFDALRMAYLAKKKSPVGGNCINRTPETENTIGQNGKGKHYICDGCPFNWVDMHRVLRRLFSLSSLRPTMRHTTSWLSAAPTRSLVLADDFAPTSSKSNPLRLWYSAPASLWNDSMPIGNGRLGGMIRGAVGTGTGLVE